MEGMGPFWDPSSEDAIRDLLYRPKTIREWRQYISKVNQFFESSWSLCCHFFNAHKLHPLCINPPDIEDTNQSVELNDEQKRIFLFTAVYLFMKLRPAPPKRSRA